MLRSKSRDRNKGRSRNLSGNIPNSDSALRVEAALGQARSAIMYRVTSNPILRNSRGDLCTVPMRLGFSRFMGVGIRYKAFSASNGTTVTITDDNGYSTSGKMKDNIQIAFIGPMYCTRFTSGNGLHTFTADIGVGYVNYRDKGMIIKNMKLTGGTLGLLYNIGYDYALSKKWAIGVNLSSIEGTLSSLTLEQDGVRTSQTLDKDNKENLGHIDLSFTLKLNL